MRDTHRKNSPSMYSAAPTVSKQNKRIVSTLSFRLMSHVSCLRSHASHGLKGTRSKLAVPQLHTAVIVKQKTRKRIETQHSKDNCAVVHLDYVEMHQSVKPNRQSPLQFGLLLRNDLHSYLAQTPFGAITTSSSLKHLSYPFSSTQPLPIQFHSRVPHHHVTLHYTFRNNKALFEVKKIIN